MRSPHSPTSPSALRARPFLKGWNRLQIARLLGASAFALLAQIAVDMPHGYFGQANRITDFGWLHAAILLGLVVLASAGYWRGQRWAAFPAAAAFALNVGVFVPVLVVDPVIAGFVVLWNLVLLAVVLLPGGLGAAEAGLKRTGPPASSEERWVEANGRATLHLATVALLLTLLIMGYGVISRIHALILCGGFDLIVLAVVFPYLVVRVRRRRRRAIIASCLLLAAVATLGRPAVSLAIFAGFLAILWSSLASRTQIFADVLQHFIHRPAELVLGSFFVLICVGTVFLSLPAAAAGGQAIRGIDALFTATSASCVTGLIVLDTPVDFSTGGQLVILLLIQVGGLSIMVLSTFTALILRRDVGWQGERVVAQLFDLQSIGSAMRLTSFVVFATLACEGLGAALLAIGFLRHGLALPEALWRGVFHAISAFCNAGFSLQSASLIPYNRDPFMLLVLAGLIILGGLGFVVLADVWTHRRGRRPQGLSIHSKLVFVVTGLLVASGALAWLALDWNRSLAGLSFLDKAANAIFQSVTMRTAGFNSVDLTISHPSLVLMTIVFMFVGASPGGTGGGIKTTTAAVLFGAIPALARRKPAIVFFGRTVSLETFYRSAAIAVVGAVIVLLGTAFLLATQALPLDKILYEVVSAFGTVGLSLNATFQLDEIGKFIIVLVMFAGRVGPLTLAILLGRFRSARIEYPDVKIMVG